MKLNTKNFKKIECDEHATTLQHPDGHTIKIAHKSLSPENKKELDALPAHYAKGGKITYKEFSKRFEADKASGASKSSNTMPGSPTNASQSYTEPNDMGTSIPRTILQGMMQSRPKKYDIEDQPHEPDVVLNALNRKAPPYGPLSAEPEHHYPPCINPSCKSYGKSHPNCRCYGGNPEGQAHGEMAGHFAKGGSVESYCSTDQAHKSDCQYFKAGGVAEGDMPGEVPQEAQQDSMMSPDPQGSPAPMEVEEPMTVTAQDPNVNPNPEMQSADASQAPADDMATPPMPQDAPTALNKFQAEKQAHAQELFPEAQAFKEDLDNGHITPETYSDLFAKKSTLGKLGTMFGLLVGGAGAGLSHQPNVLLDMMNKEIDRDLQAQQESSQNKQNFLKINQQNSMNKAQAGVLKADAAAKAYALSKVQMNYTGLHSFVANAAKLPPGPQKDQANQVLAMLNQGVQNENFNILDRAASGAAFYNTMFGNTSGGAGPQGEQQFQNQVKARKALGPQGEKIAEDMEAKHYPGIPGQASMPLNGADRDEIHSGMEFSKQLQNYVDWAKSHSGDLSPKDMAYGKSLAAGVQGAYRMATHGGVYKEGEQNFISKIIDDNPSKFFNEIRVLPKVQAVMDQHQIRMDQLLKSKGFSGYKAPSSQQQSAPQQQIKIVNGKKYKRGPNGEAIEVN